jgi:hypothetical protein
VLSAEPTNGSPLNKYTSPPAAPEAVSPQSPLQTATPPLAPQSSTPAPATPQAQHFYQEIDIQRAPKFSILGTVTAQDLHYQILSELHVGIPNDDGSRKIEQYVHETRLLKADELSRSMFEQSLRDLRGWQFTYRMSRRGQIIDWRSGPPDGRKAARVAVKGVEGFMVTSVMDEDGWKEMAQLSFFVPEEHASGSPSWTRQMTHDFGPLGSWYGETRYAPQAIKEGLLQVDYAHDMTYAPPAKGGGDLPFTVAGATFKPEVAGGTFRFDTQARRVQSVQERFLVKGALTAEILGQTVPLEVEEDQIITLRVLESNPWEK